MPHLKPEADHAGPAAHVAFFHRPAVRGIERRRHLRVMDVTSLYVVQGSVESFRYHRQEVPLVFRMFGGGVLE